MTWIVGVFRIVGGWRLEEVSKSRPLSLGLGIFCAKPFSLVRGGKESTPDHMMHVHRPAVQIIGYDNSSAY